MMGFKDTTFCTATTCTKFDNCDRALTEQVKEDAEKWWGGKDYPIALLYQPEKHMECYEPTTTKEEVCQ